MCKCVDKGTKTYEGKSYCKGCGAAIGQPPLIAESTLLTNPTAAQTRILCVGHGTWRPEDGSFQVPDRVTIRFRVPDRAATPGHNDQAILAPEDCKPGGQCKNYRLWALTGLEETRLEKQYTTDATNFVHGWKTEPGEQRWLYVGELGGSVLLRQIVWGLSDGVPMASPRTWEVVWMACREHMTMTNEEYTAEQKKHDGHGVKFY